MWTISVLFHTEIFKVVLLTAVPLVLVLAWISVVSRMKAYPKCAGSNCGARSYKLIGTMDNTGANSGVIFECKKCGRKYLQKRLTFMTLDKNLQASSFMKRESIKSAWELDG